MASELVGMGFPEPSAREALRRVGGNVEQALEWLLNNSEEAATPAVNAEPPARTVEPGSREARVRAAVARLASSPDAFDAIREIVDGALRAPTDQTWRVACARTLLLRRSCRATVPVWFSSPRVSPRGVAR